MGAPRRQRDLIKSRRRIEDEGEDEGSVAAVEEEDSLSEGSIISDADEDADVEGSDGEDVGSPFVENPTFENVVNGNGEVQAPVSAFGPTTSDTEAMMNGLNISGGTEEEGVNFEDFGRETIQQSSQSNIAGSLEGGNAGTLAERRRREHEEYKKKRDADPAFVPNRGGFFMHDHRSGGPGQNGFKPLGRGRGRGRVAVVGPSTSSSQHPFGPSDAPWAHDLHETVADPLPQNVIDKTKLPVSRAQDQPAVVASASQPQQTIRSFNKTTRIGNVQIRVLLGGMTDAIVFSAVPVNQHTRLPHHRPPLRRDKPVRISLPELPIRYIFPSVDRSFIFIPRALRPNQQGFGRIRGRGSFGAGHSAFGGLSSRRTSGGYAASGYSPSVPLSRRSSLAQDFSTDGLASPSRMMQLRLPPVVRLPQAATQVANQQVPGDASGPTVNLPNPSAYPLPQKPTYHENRQATLPMHHPKPERAVQVADIDSPATLEFNPPQQQQQQPFHQQVPPQIASQTYPIESPHSRHPSHPSQASGGTPLPQIPERAVHAQPFQPYPFQPANFYPQYPPPMYYYPTQDPSTGGPSISAPTFTPGQPFPYPVPITQAHQQQVEGSTQSSTVAHESNGMVYYYDSTQLAENAPQPPPQPPYPQQGYGIAPSVVNVGDVMNPPLYYSGAAAYYPPQQ